LTAAYNGQTMSITIRIPAPLRDYCGGSTEVILPAATVRAALVEIERRVPLLYGSICDETGRVRRHVNLFVNQSHMRDLHGFDTPLVPGDVLTIMPAVCGG
jgi:molybdopterin synthase sulfur carrier subunit